MQHPFSVSAPRGLMLGLMLAPLAACGGPTASTSAAGSAAGAGANVAVAAVAWVVGKGCNLQGCPYGSYCNHDSGFCVTRKCSEGCPDDTMCNEGLDRCQDPPPASTPNDFLPSDRQRMPIQ